MVNADRLDKIERELDRVSPATGPHEPPENPTPDELGEWYQRALENPAVDYWDAYFRMIEEVEKLKNAGVIPTAGPRAGVTDIEDGADDAQAGPPESGETDAHADSPVDGPDLPEDVADRLDGGTLAALPDDVADDVPDDLPPEQVDEAARLRREIAEGEPA